MNMIFRYVAVFLFLPVGIFISRADEAASIASGAMSFAQAVYPYEMFLSLYGKDANTVDPVSERHYDAFLALTAEHYGERFSASELEELSAFLTSPVGRKWYERDETEFTLFASHLATSGDAHSVDHMLRPVSPVLLIGFCLAVLILILARIRAERTPRHLFVLIVFTLLYSVLRLIQDRSDFGRLSSFMEHILTIMIGIGLCLAICAVFHASWQRRKGNQHRSGKSEQNHALDRTSG